LALPIVQRQKLGRQSLESETEIARPKPRLPHPIKQDKKKGKKKIKGKF
jgi:hypothetical protein